MAARSDAATDRVSRATAPSLAGVTIMGWARIDATHAGALFHPLTRIAAGGGTAAVLGFKGANGRTPSLYSGASTTGISGAEVALATWVFIAGTMNSGPAQLFYGTTPGSLTKVTGTVNTTGTPDTVTLFSRSPSDGSEWLEGALSHVRVYTAVLSDAEIATESQSAVPVRTSGLWANWELVAAALTDGSGNGRTLTAGSTPLTAETGPPLGDTFTDEGTATLTLAATGTHARATASAGTAALVLGASGAAAKTAIATGTAELALAATGLASATRSGVGIAPLTLGAIGTAARTAVGTGAAALTLTADGPHSTTRTASGAAVLTLLATGTTPADDVPAAGDPRLTIHTNLATASIRANQAILMMGDT